MKPATELIFDYLETFGVVLHDDTKFKFSEIHKKQIIEAAKHGENFENSPYANAEEYYFKTYGLIKNKL
jgi:hypothetical protein